MNLVELIIWVFAALLAIGLAVVGYNWFGLLGVVGGLAVGAFVGLCIGVGTAKLFYRPRPRKKRPSASS
jgi:hypothetical protein